MVKIGKTTRDVFFRFADLYSTWVPLPFECEYAALLKYVDETKKKTLGLPMSLSDGDFHYKEDF